VSHGFGSAGRETAGMIAMKSRALAVAAIAAGALLAACSSTSNPSPLPQPTSTVGPLPAGHYIKHVVFIVQENRSFENMFAGWPGANAPMTGKMSDGSTIALKPLSYSQEMDICHVWGDALRAYDGGKMDGFDRERQTVGGGGCVQGSQIGTYPYHYMDHAEIAPYRTLASEYVLADAMFPTEFGTSFTAHQDLIAGTTQIEAGHSLVNTPSAFPWGCDAPPGTITPLVDTHRVITPNGPFPCVTQYPTIADSLDAGKVSWRYYVELPPSQFVQSSAVWDAFDVIAKVRCASFTPPSHCAGQGADWTKNMTSRPTQILSDPAKGDLPGVSWVIPDLNWADYPATTSDEGPSWVGDIVNAIGKSKYWDSTAIVVLWDDWGGFYDNAPPPQLDYVGNAIRVPCIIISPYAKHGVVSHTQYEYGSLLKFVEQVFDVASLHTTDDRANSIIDAFDFSQKPRKFVPVATKYPPSKFINSSPTFKAPDDDF